MDADELHRLVEAYASFGDHHTGTAVDRTTRAWLRDELVARGGVVVEDPYEFPRFVARHHVVTVDGAEVPSAPLWYAGEGVWSTSHVERRVVHGQDLVAPGDPAVPVVAADRSAGDRLVVPNRGPRDATDRPHAIVPGAAAALLAGAEVRYDAELRTVLGDTANVRARFGPVAPDPVLVVTPLTGWFRCAGERATGIAVALTLAEALAEHHPVVFVGTTGHEIGQLGVRHLVTALRPRARAVVHVGASVGAGERTEAGDLAFGARRWALTSVPAHATGGIAAAVTEAGYAAVTSDPEEWYGEGGVLRGLDAPVLSFLGLFELFHTPDDVPGAATSPALLASAARGVVAGASAFLDVATATAGAGAG